DPRDGRSGRDRRRRPRLRPGDGQGLPGVLHVGQAHQRQDDLLLRPGPRWLGHRIRNRRKARGRALLHRRGDHRGQLLGPRMDVDARDEARPAERTTGPTREVNPVTTSNSDFDAVVVGAGISGLYAVYKLRGLGMRVHGFESAEGVGGTWYHNRYPGARCDVESIDYSYSFDEQLQQEWTWTERFATQEEILRYIEHVADRHDLRSAYDFLTRVSTATYDDRTGRWTVSTDTGHNVTTRFLVLATGVLSATNIPDIPGRDTFGGEIYHTGEWPHEPLDLAGKRIGVIGTGSSAIQAIPVIAQPAEHLYVFQRTPIYSIPARNRPLDPEFVAEVKANYAERRRLSRISGGGTPNSPYPKGALEVDEAERTRVYDEWWQRGGYLFAKAFPDQTTNLAANDTAREYVEAKIRALVHDQELADQLIPNDHPIGTKRIVTDSGYFQTYNRDNVTLVNLRRTPIQQITETGVRTEGGAYEVDVLIFATGFDAMTGSLNRIDIRGRDGRQLR